MATKNKNKNMDLRDLLVSKISVLYDVETTLVKALGKMAKASTDPILKKGFADHLKETENQAKRLEKIFSILDVKPKKLKSEAIRGLVKDGEWVIKNVDPEDAMDANLARAAQYVEHYEIAGYLAAISWAEELGEEKIVSLLEETLAEEQLADEKLDEVGSVLQKEIVI